MSIPRKEDLTRTLRYFAKELHDVAKAYSNTEAARESREEVTAIATMAEKAADSINATDRPYVHPATAQTLFDFAADVAKIAERSTDPLYQASLNIAATSLRTFVLQRTPVATTGGFEFAE